MGKEIKKGEINLNKMLKVKYQGNKADTQIEREEVGWISRHVIYRDVKPVRVKEIRK